MAPRYRSGRLFQQFIGVSDYTDERLVLDVIGNARISGILTVPQLYVTGEAGQITGDLSARNLLITGISTFQGPITAGSSTGQEGQYLQRTATGVTWASFPAVRTSTYHSATVGQTTFAGAYNAQFVDIYLNGVKLHTSEFTASNGTHVVLNQGCFAEDVVEVVSFNATSMGAGGGLGNGGSALGINTTGTSLFNHINASGIVTAGQFVGDGSQLTGLAPPGIGINSGGVQVGAGVTIINFTGAGNTFFYNASTQTLDIDIDSDNFTVPGISTLGTSDFNNLSIVGVSTFADHIAANGDLDVDGHTELDNLNVSGVSTFVGDAQFNSNVSIAGTLTYEDVKNVDSVGLITARSGIEVVGIITAQAGAAVTYYGDGSGLVGVLRPSIITSDSPPSSPNDGELWWESSSGVLKVYYEDVDSGQWVDASPTSGGAGSIQIINDSTPQLGGELDVNGSDITGTGNINLTGIITSTSLYTGDGTFSGDVSIAGDVSIGGTLTYEDVRNVDSVGLITAREGIDVNARGINIDAGGLNVVAGIATFAADIIANSNIDLAGDIDVDGHTNLDNVSIAGVSTFVGVSTFQNDLSVAGDLNVDRHTNLDNVSISGVTTVAGNITANGSLDLAGDVDVDGHTNLDNVNITGVTTFSANSNNVVVGGATTALLVDGDLRVTGVGSFGAGSVSIATSAISYTGYGTTIGIGTAPANWGTAVTEALELGAEKIHLNAGTTWIGGHILPTQHEQFDLGSANKKIRHLFLSDNSIWLGDQNKIDTSTGNMKMKKRHVDSLPKSITDLSGDSAGAISHANTEFAYSPAKTQLKQLTLQDLLSYLTSLDATKTEITDLYPPEMIGGNANSAYTDTDWQKINVDATVGPQNPFVTKGFSSPP